MNSRNRQTEEQSSRELAAARSAQITQVNLSAAEEDEMEIDLVDLAYMLLDKLHYIILCFLAGAVLLNAYAYFLVAPTYQSTSKIYVVSASDDSVVNLSDLNIGTSLTQDYVELIMSYPVLERVIDRMDLDMDSDQLAGMISLTNPSNTRILNITVTSTDRTQAMEIANTMAEVSIQYLPDTMSTLAPNIAQEAKEADEMAGPGYLKYTMIGALLGTILYCGYLIVKYLLDDTIHTAEDLEKYFGLVPLTTIPENEQFSMDDKGVKTAEKTRRRSRGRK